MGYRLRVGRKGLFVRCSGSMVKGLADVMGLQYRSVVDDLRKGSVLWLHPFFIVSDGLPGRPLGSRKMPVR